MAKLTYVVGSESRSVEVGDSCSIGRIAGNTIVLESEEGCSRKHCQILKIASGWELADLGSTNGTKVNGAAVKRHRLVHGDRVQIGKTELRFEDPSSAPAAEEEISLEEPAGSEAPAPAPKSGGASEGCCLVYAGGPKDGQKIALDKPRVTFGRNAKNVVQLDDANVSGYHAEVSREGGAFVLRDLGSTNGTLVDGEPVTEVALQHGARIRLGSTRLVFVDPAVSDFEKAMAAVDDLGSEWGLLRAEMDMTRVQQARRSQAVMAVVILVVVLGGGGFVLMNPQILAGEKKKIEKETGNRVSDFSFEELGGSDWAARDGSPTKAKGGDPRSEGAARQGSAFYAVARDGGPGTCAAAQSSLANAFTVSPGQPVKFGAWVRAANGGKGGVRVLWLDRPDATGREVGRSATPLAASSDWQSVTAQAVPPDGARVARLELVNAAGGTAYFDDVLFAGGDGAGGAVAAADGDVRISATADGQTTLSRGDAVLLGAAAVVGGAGVPESIDDPSRRGDRVGSASVREAAKDGAGVRFSGQVVEPATGQLSDFRLSVTSSGGRYVDVKAEAMPAGAAWTANLPQEFVKAGIGVQVGDDPARRIDEARLLDKVREVTFGGDHLFKVTAAAGTTMRVGFSKVGDAWEVGFGAADGKLSMRIDTDSKELLAAVNQLRAEANAAKQQRKFGVAIVKLNALVSHMSKGSADGAQIEADAKALEDAGKERLAALDTRASGALEFRDSADLAAVETEARTLAEEYDQHPVGASAVTVGASAAKAIAELRMSVAERLAAPLLRKAEDFFEKRQDKAQMPSLAKAFYREIVQRYPGTEAEKRARARLAELDSGK